MMQFVKYCAFFLAVSIPIQYNKSTNSGLANSLSINIVGEAFRLPAVKCCKIAKTAGENATRAAGCRPYLGAVRNTGGRLPPLHCVSHISPYNVF